MGWPFEEKKIFVKPEWREGKPSVRPSLDHVDLTRSDSLSAPWPDLVITAGRRLSAVGLFVKQASQGRTRLVLIGKPRRAFEQFDLAVVAEHYTLPEGPTVARHALPLTHPDPAALERAAALWRERLAAYRKPLTALMVGGRTGGLKFDREIARTLVEETRAHVERTGGSLFATTSRRTPPEVVKLIEEALPSSAGLYVFDPDSGPETNPYHGLLALADDFVVTTDSISMMVEVVRLGRSLSLFPLSSELTAVERWAEKVGLLRPLSPREDPLPAGGVWARALYRLGRPRHSRDLSAIPRLLVRQGLATWLGEPRHIPEANYVDDALERAAERIRALFSGVG